MPIPSLRSRLFYRFLRFINKKKFLEMQFAFGRFDFNNCKEPPRDIRKICRVSKSTFGGRNVYTLSPKKHGSSHHILYLHGGAYVHNFVKQHWNFLGMLVSETNCTITAPDYPLAPQHSYIDSFEMLIALYAQVVMTEKPANMILMGDSAGGGLALALAQKIKLEALRRPNQLILLSPWLDITLSNPAIDEIDRLDPFLSVTGLRRAGLAYAGGADPRHFLLSPINGELEDVGEISLFIGAYDLLVADARKLDRMAREKSVPINYREYPAMVHVWMFLSFPEARSAQKEIVDLIVAGNPSGLQSVDPDEEVV